MYIACIYCRSDSRKVLILLLNNHPHGFLHPDVNGLDTRV